MFNEAGSSYATCWSNKHFKWICWCNALLNQLSMYLLPHKGRGTNNKCKSSPKILFIFWFVSHCPRGSVWSHLGGVVVGGGGDLAFWLQKGKKETGNSGCQKSPFYSIIHTASKKKTGLIPSLTKQQNNNKSFPVIQLVRNFAER